MRLHLQPERPETNWETRAQIDFNDDTIVPLNVGSVDFRHLSAFKRVYLEKSYANAGISLSTTRKSIRRMMQNLERVFECDLFREGDKGELYPTAFSERLFNDLRFLHAAQCRLKDHIASIHENGRMLHIGSSPAVFRTTTFRSLFKELQSTQGVRLSYSAMDSDEACKSLLSGHCDLYIGSWTGQAKRFVTVSAGNVPFRFFQRLSGDRERKIQPLTKKSAYVVNLDGVGPTHKCVPDCGIKWQDLTEAQWMRWLSYPEECAPDTIICAPDIAVDETRWAHWHAIPQQTALQVDLHASFLRQHPYEFLPALAGKIRNHVAKS